MCYTRKKLLLALFPGCRCLSDYPRSCLSLCLPISTHINIGLAYAYTHLQLHVNAQVQVRVQEQVYKFKHTSTSTRSRKHTHTHMYVLRSRRQGKSKGANTYTQDLFFASLPHRATLDTDTHKDILKYRERRIDR